MVFLEKKTFVCKLFSVLKTVSARVRSGSEV
jgi:hypothetical protein